MAEKMWSYKDYQIKEGLKPDSKHFQYFFLAKPFAESPLACHGDECMP